MKWVVGALATADPDAFAVEVARYREPAAVDALQGRGDPAMHSRDVGATRLAGEGVEVALARLEEQAGIGRQRLGGDANALPVVLDRCMRRRCLGGRPDFEVVFDGFHWRGCESRSSFACRPR